MEKKIIKSGMPFVLAGAAVFLFALIFGIGSVPSYLFAVVAGAAGFAEGGVGDEQYLIAGNLAQYFHQDAGLFIGCLSDADVTRADEFGVRCGAVLLQLSFVPCERDQFAYAPLVFWRFHIMSSQCHDSGCKGTTIKYNESPMVGKDGLTSGKTTHGVVSKREKVKPGVRLPGLKVSMKWVLWVISLLRCGIPTATCRKHR